MKLYNRYILKLLFLRFTAIMLCVSFFGVFQEFAKGKLLLMCTFWQTTLILPLMLPLILFQFLPFIYFGALLLVQNELYSNNELISFKAVGLSNKQIMSAFLMFSCFALFVFVLLGIVYPHTNSFFLKKRNMFGVKNVLKTIQPQSISQLGKYKILCDKIDKKGILHDVSVFLDKENNTSFGTINNISLDKKIIFSEKMFFGYNEFNELLVCLVDGSVVMIEFDNDLRNKSLYNNTSEIQKNVAQTSEDRQNLNPALRRAVYAQKVNILFDDFLTLSDYSVSAYKQKLRQMGVVKLFKAKADDKNNEHMKRVEIHSRVVVYWFVITALTFICCLLLKRQVNRISSSRLMLAVIVLGFIVSLSRAFVLDAAVMNYFTSCLYYLHFIIICVICWVSIRKNDINCV